MHKKYNYQIKKLFIYHIFECPLIYFYYSLCENTKGFGTYKYSSSQLMFVFRSAHFIFKAFKLDTPLIGLTNQTIDNCKTRWFVRVSLYLCGIYARIANRFVTSKPETRGNIEEDAKSKRFGRWSGKKQKLRLGMSCF